MNVYCVFLVYGGWGGGLIKGFLLVLENNLNFYCSLNFLFIEVVERSSGRR